MSEQHRLINDTLVREKDGIVAHCICGWSSRPHFSSLSASAAMQDHKEHPEKQDDKRA